MPRAGPPAGLGRHHREDLATMSGNREALKQAFDRVVQKVDEHPVEASKALRATAIRIDRLIQGCDEQSRVDVYNAVWRLMIELKDYAEMDHTINGPRARSWNPDDPDDMRIAGEVFEQTRQA